MGPRSNGRGAPGADRETECVLGVGGIRLVIRSEARLIDPAGDPAYADFLNPWAEAVPDLQVEVRVDSAGAGVPPGARLLYEGSPWRVWRAAGTVILEHWGGRAVGHPYLRLFVPGEGPAVRVSLMPPSLEGAGVETGTAFSFHYPLDQMLLMYLLLRCRGLIVHAAGLAAGGRGILFPGQSGAGKSTISRLLRDRPGFLGLSDDRIIVRRTGDGFRVFGTPWPGTGGIAVSAAVPLDRILFLRHAPDNAIRPLTPREALARLLPALSIPWYDAQAVPGALDLAGELLQGVPAAELSFRPDPAVGAFLEEWLHHNC